MKHLLLFIFLLVSTAGVAQNAIADLKFEEAELAYNSGKYDVALKKLQEYETAKGNTTAKALFLRVVSQNKLFNADNVNMDENQFALYISLSENSAKYLKAMENEGLDDKFREVYAISERLKELNIPKDKAVWQKNKALKEQKAIDDAKEKADKQQMFLTYSYLNKNEYGMGIEEYCRKYDIKKKEVFKASNRNSNDYDRITYSGANNTFFLKEKLVGYQSVESGLYKEYESAKVKIQEKVAYFTELFGFEPTEKTMEKVPGGDSIYTWQRDNKTFTMEAHLVQSNIGAVLTLTYRDLLKTKLTSPPTKETLTRGLFQMMQM